MQLPNPKTAITRCETASNYTQEALRRYPTHFRTTPEQTARLNALITTLGTATGALLAAQSAYRAAVIAVAGPRVGVKLIDLKADAAVRTAKRAAEDAGADIAAAVFPSGITPIIKPVGQTEVRELSQLEGRIAAAGSWSAGAAQLALIVAVRTDYETALRERAAASTAAGAKRALRDSVREDFLDVFASVAAAIKEMFPRDRPKQDVFFDSVRDTSTDDADEPDDGGEPVTPVAG